MLSFVLILSVLGIILFSIHQTRKVREVWSAAALRLRLRYDPGGGLSNHKITGSVDGYELLVETFSRRSGKSSSTYTRYRVSYPHSLGLGLSLTRQGFFSSMAKALGAQDIELGDPDFDHLVMVKGRNEVSVRTFLTSIRKTWIRRMMLDLEDFRVDDSGAQAESVGAEKSEVVLVQKLQRMLEFARNMTGNSPSRSQPRVPSSSSPAPKQSEPVIIETIPVPVDEIAVRNELPEDPHQTEVSVIAENLFCGNQGVTEINRLFVSEYLDRGIEGEGVFRGGRETRFDFVFGEGPYYKATVELPLSGQVSGGHRSFQVILRLPIGSEIPAPGKKIRFSGRLIKVDALMRQLYVITHAVT